MLTETGEIFTSGQTILKTIRYSTRLRSKRLCSVAALLYSTAGSIPSTAKHSVGKVRINLVQMTWYGLDHSYIIDLIANAPDTFVGTGIMDQR